MLNSSFQSLDSHEGTGSIQSGVAIEMPSDMYLGVASLENETIRAPELQHWIVWPLFKHFHAYCLDVPRHADCANFITQQSPQRQTTLWTEPVTSSFDKTDVTPPGIHTGMPVTLNTQPHAAHAIRSPARDRRT
eukprot:673285-Pyramimonas_sp.AAC.1